MFLEFACHQLHQLNSRFNYRFAERFEITQAKRGKFEELSLGSVGRRPKAYIMRDGCLTDENALDFFGYCSLCQRRGLVYDEDVSRQGLGLPSGGSPRRWA
jgi:hypothetical protein